MARLLMKNASHIVTCDPSDTVYTDCHLLMENGVITYIGPGLSVETPSLGNLVNDGRKVMMQAGLRYQLLYPTLILSFVTIAFYLIGNAFSDAADPKNHLQ